MCHLQFELFLTLSFYDTQGKSGKRQVANTRRLLGRWRPFWYSCQHLMAARYYATSPMMQHSYSLLDSSAACRIILVINPFMPLAFKTAWLFWWYLSNKSNFQKIFEGEKLIKVQLTTPLEMFCEFSVYYKVILKSVKGPDGTCLRDLQACMG